jgi:hypothetical protein
MKRPLPEAASAVHACLASRERAGEQQRDDRVPAVLGEVFDRGDVLDARVGDHDVEPAERLQRGGDGACVALAGREVGLVRNDPVPTGPWVQVGRQHVVAVGEQALGHGAADSAGGAGDEGGGHAAMFAHARPGG